MTEAVLLAVILALLALVAWKDLRHSVERKRWDEALHAEFEQAGDERHRFVDKLLSERERHDAQHQAWDVERGRYVAALLQVDANKPAAAAAVRVPPARPAAEPVPTPIDL